MQLLYRVAGRLDPAAGNERFLDRHGPAPGAAHQDQHGQPITRDALRARLGVSTQAASHLLRQLRASQNNLPPGVSRINPARRALKGEQS